MSLELRPYQRAAIDALYAFFQARPGNPLAVLPTGSGKSLVQAMLIREACERWPATRILCLTHVKELIRQNVDELRAVWPLAPLGINSAGLGQRNYDAPVIFAGIASVYDKAADLGRFDLAIVDEAHLINTEGAGMYRSLLRDLTTINPALRVIGLTATPYRLGSGMLTEGADRIFTDIAYSADLKELIRDGYLAPLVSKAGQMRVDLSSVKTRAGEFVQGDLEAAFDTKNVTAAALDEVCSLAADRHAWLFFCSGVAHAHHVAEALTERGIPAGCVTGETEKAERDELIAKFKRGELRALTNANVLTTGFNVPSVDLLVFLRPTQSTSLYVQMAGRGMRRAEGKTDCLVLDYSGNVVRHGPVDAVAPERAKEKGTGEAPAKECPQCRLIVPAGLAVCLGCGFEFPKREPEEKIERKASDAPILSEPPHDERWEVYESAWRVHKKRDAGESHPKTLMVSYGCVGINRRVSEWVCFEHSGFARRKAEAWWAERMGSAPCPTVALDALNALDKANNDKVLKEPVAVIVRIGGKYPELLRCEFARPCSSCRHYDGGHCAKWSDDVPESHREIGCQFHEVAQEAATVPASDEVPF